MSLKVQIVVPLKSLISSCHSFKYLQKKYKNGFTNSQTYYYIIKIYTARQHFKEEIIRALNLMLCS